MEIIVITDTQTIEDIRDASMRIRFPRSFATDAEFAAPVAGSWLHAGDVDPLSDTRQPCSR